MSGENNRSVLDASAVLAVLNGEPGQNRVRDLLPKSVISSVNLGEVLAKLISRGIPVPQAVAAFDALHLDTLPFDQTHAVRSADYARSGVSLGDRAFLATAHLSGVTGWTSDGRLLDIDSVSMPELANFRPDAKD